MKSKLVLVAMLAISIFAECGCDQTWTGQVCEETSNGLDCAGNNQAHNDAHFALQLENKSSIHLEWTDSLIGYKGYKVIVQGSLAGHTIHATSVKQIDKKQEKPGPEAGKPASLAPDNSKTSASSSIPVTPGFTREFDAGDRVSSLTNATVVDLKKNGVDDDAVVDYIYRADTVHFDLGFEALSTLSNAGVDDKVVAAMKERVRADDTSEKSLDNNE